MYGDCCKSQQSHVWRLRVLVRGLVDDEAYRMITGVSTILPSRSVIRAT